MLVTGAATSWNGLRDGPWDAIVIGAGPAGALAARELAARGASVLIVEKRAFPRAKVCGGCMNRRALDVLDAAGLGSLVERSGGVPLGQLRIHFRGRRAQLPLPVGMALSRDRLDAALVSAAIEAGATFLPETIGRVGDVADGTRRVTLKNGGEDRAIDGRVVLAASGLGGACLTPGAPCRARIAPGSRIGAGCRLASAPAGHGDGTIVMAVARSGYVGLVRMEDGGLNLAASFEPELVRRHGTLAAAAAVVLDDAGLPPIAGLEAVRWQGTPRLTRQVRPVAADRLFLLGDAAGYVEPFTGEGIAWALASGRAIAPLAMRGVAGWEPRLARDWDVLHRRLVRHRQLVCQATAAILHHPWLTHLTFELLARLPGAAGGVLRHVNATPFFNEAS